MADGVNIDFSALRPVPDFATSYANAFTAGQTLGKAAATHGVDPPAVTVPRAGLPSGMAGGGTQGAYGNVSTLEAQLDALPVQQQAAAVAAAQARNEQMAHVLLGLKGYPVVQRLRIAQHLASITGLLDPSGITQADVTDQGIDSHLATAMSIEQFLKQQAGRPPGAAREGPPPAETSIQDIRANQMPVETQGGYAAMSPMAPRLRYVGKAGD